MRALTKTGRALILTGFLVLCATGVCLAVMVAVLGYACFCVGMPKVALGLWTTTTLLLSLLAVLGSILSDYRQGKTSLFSTEYRP